MLSPQPTLRSQLLDGANSIPWSLLDIVAAFPEEAGPHFVEGEWSIRDQLLHLQNVELRYTIPNLKALRDGDAWVPFGEDDREPDRGDTLESIAVQLAEIYNERVALLRQILPGAWRGRLEREGKPPVNLEEILTEECVQHDAEHLSQLLGTFADWQARVGGVGAHRDEVDFRAVLLSAADTASENALSLVGVLDEAAGSFQPAAEGEWSIAQQVRHLTFVDRRYTIPNVRAIMAGGAYTPYGATAGVDDLEPDRGASLDELRQELRATYDERNALLMSVPAEQWLKTIEGEDGKQISVEYLVVQECVRHDCEHLSQMLGTARQWRVRTGDAAE